jgi:signal transduction histidine kinase
MPAAVELALYFVCSEALTNASKHARASRAAIRVSFERRAVLLAVDDDGVGGASSDAGSGLAGLVDRVEALGGTLRIISAEGRGTHLRVELPIT